jgi:proteic killer suppression protein
LTSYKRVVYKSGDDPIVCRRRNRAVFRQWQTGRLPRDILRRAAMRLRQLDAATKIGDLRLPPSNRLEALKGDRAGRHAIRINDQWRLVFRFEDGDAFEVEIVDYH